MGRSSVWESRDRRTAVDYLCRFTGYMGYLRMIADRKCCSVALCAITLIGGGGEGPTLHRRVGEAQNRKCT